MGVFPNPWYLPPCDGGRSGDRCALIEPRPAKKDSFAAFCDSGVDAPPIVGELEDNGAGDEES